MVASRLLSATAAILSLCSVTVFAAPATVPVSPRQSSPSSQQQQCMSDTEAYQLAGLYGELIANFNNVTAEAVLTPNFTDYSESVNTLIRSCPQGDAAMHGPQPGPLDPTFSSRLQFMVGQGQQPKIHFIPLQIWHGCTELNIRWMTDNTATRPIPDEKPVVGIITAEVVKSPYGSQYPWWIHTVYSEFDAGTWLQNLQASGTCGGPGAAPPLPGAPQGGPPAQAPPAQAGPPISNGVAAGSSNSSSNSSAGSGMMAVVSTGSNSIMEMPASSAH